MAQPEICIWPIVTKLRHRGLRGPEPQRERG